VDQPALVAGKVPSVLSFLGQIHQNYLSAIPSTQHLMLLASSWIRFINCYMTTIFSALEKTFGLWDIRLEGIWQLGMQ
jgi:hypothetical protein